MVVGNKVIVGCECNTIYALDKTTGKTIWERHVNGAVKAAPAYSDGIVYVGDYAGEMNAIRVSDGSIKWQTGSQGSGFGRSGRFYATATVAFGRVYAGNIDGRMYSFDQRTGDLAWSHSTGNYVYAAAVAAGRRTRSPRSTSAPTTGPSTRSTRAPGMSAGRRPTCGSISGAASLIGETVYVADLRTTSDLRLQRRQRPQGPAVLRWRLQPGHLQWGGGLSTGYKTIYALTPGQGAAVDGIVQAPKKSKKPKKATKKKPGKKKAKAKKS